MIQKILVENPGARILILTTYGATADAARALNAGAVSAISKDSSQESLLAAIRATAKVAALMSAPSLKRHTCRAVFHRSKAVKILKNIPY